MRLISGAPATIFLLEQPRMPPATETRSGKTMRWSICRAAPRLSSRASPREEGASVRRLSASSKAGPRSGAPIVMSFGGHNGDLLRSAPAQSAIDAQVGRAQAVFLVLEPAL